MADDGSRQRGKRSERGNRRARDEGERSETQLGLDGSTAAAGSRRSDDGSGWVLAFRVLIQITCRTQFSGSVNRVGSSVARFGSTVASDGSFQIQDHFNPVFGLGSGQRWSNSQHRSLGQVSCFGSRVGSKSVY
ncbi:hypothetical protein Hdeb2414_s0057g00758731 [Helianthus debilis subsp. tardiflorus]